ncbi:MAG TPA: hypothetical protein VHH92_03020 [Actinomycetota bacterium]|nr:hypothetical protein [Actinomycetota bacterium]
MQLSPPPSPPPRRIGTTVAIVLLAVGFAASTTIAVVEYVQLREARQEIEELRASQGAGGSGGLFGELGEILEEAVGDLGESFGGGAGQGALDCLTPPEPFSGEPIDDLPVEQQVTAIADQVERLRGLRFTEPVEPRFVSPEESAARVRELFLEEYTPAIGDIESRILGALGAVPRGTDLRELRADLLGQQVAGFYDPETGELVVRRAGSTLSLNDRVVLAHELDHALTDQALGIPLPDDLRAGMEDVDLAATALVEGDATLLMQQYMLSAPFGDQLGALDPSAFTEAIEAQAALSDLPPYLLSELTFPYEEGLEFVCALYQEGGWEAVNRAYDDPPTASVEVLFPNRYRDGAGPDDAPDPSGPGPGWVPRAATQLGAANLLWLFEAPGGEPSRAIDQGIARSAVEAWHGGEVHLWTDGARSAVAVRFLEDAGADGLCPAVQEWYGASVQGDRVRGTREGGFLADGANQDAAIACSDDMVALGIAPDLRTARALVR